MTKEGYVEKIVYHNEANDYTVLGIVTEDEEEETLVGTMSGVSEGTYLVAECEEITHPSYGVQYKVSSFEVKMPDDLLGIEKYLGSGVIKGIGEIMAKKIVKTFKKDTFRIIEEEPERLAEIKGISLNKAQDIAIQFNEKKDLRDAMVYLAKFDISPQVAVRIYETYGNDMYGIIELNPYQIAEDVVGIGFKTADAIAIKSGIHINSEFRCRAAMVYCLAYAASMGHIYLPVQTFHYKVQELLSPDGLNIVELPVEIFENQLSELVLERKVVIKELEGNQIVYDTRLYHMELDIARRLIELDVVEHISDDEIDSKIQNLEDEQNIELDVMQRDAIKMTIRNGFTIITGGPGTGKTTTIHTIIDYFEKEKMSLLLAAPTGRAAKRITETSGYPAQTIHRMLEISGGGDGEEGYTFEKNEQNPLETDVIIIDEASMVDTYLMHALLKAVIPGTHLILVGDENQLPSVGPGNILRDILSSNCFKSCRLTKIFRQDEDSAIVVNAHKINEGEMPSISNKSKDFFMISRNDPRQITDEICQLVKTRLPKYLQVSSQDIQVLTPRRTGDLSVESLNPVLQDLLNPGSNNKLEHVFHGTIFREGDKVMQIKNDYKLEWEIRSKKGQFVKETGTGVFNGDMGVIEAINEYSQIITVLFDDNKIVEYPYAAMNELELAYAITVHKSQGSEYPAVVMPVLSTNKLLFNRNLLYTAVTRAKKCVVLIGSEYSVKNMIANADSQRRYSSLNIRLKELGGEGWN